MNVKKTFVLAAALALVSLGFLGGQAEASVYYENYSGGWVPNDPNANGVIASELTFTKSGVGSFYIRSSDGSSWLELLNDGNFMDGTWRPSVITFGRSVSGNYMAYVSAPSPWSTEIGSVDLGDSLEFGFYFWNGSEKFNNYELSQNADGTFLLNSNDVAMTVNIENASPLPVPPSMVLFGCGLLGLVSFGLHRNKFNS